MPKASLFDLRSVKFLSKFLSVLVSCLLLSRASHGGIIFTFGSDTVVSGHSVTLPVTVTDFSGVGVFQFDMNYDSALLQYVSPPSSLGLPDLTFYSPSPGTVRVSWDDVTINPNGVTIPNGTIFALTFLAIGTSGFSSLTFVPTELLDGNLQNITGATYTPGTVEVTPVPEPITAALGVFACVFIGAAAVRHISSKRTAPL